MICDTAEGWSSCSEKIKKAIQAAATPQEAFAAAQEWADRYEKLYATHPGAGWTASDQQRLEAAGERLFDEAIGKYLDPAGIALDMALERYLPRLAALIGILNSGWVLGFYMLLAPSPIANDFTAAKPVNDEINKLLFDKLDAFMPLNWRDNYSSMMERAFQETKGDLVKP
jgi:hypothetical protein